MKVNLKILKLFPFILLLIYYLAKFLFPNIINENGLFVLSTMIIISLISFRYILKREPLQNIKKQKIIQLSFGLFITFLMYTYFLNVG